MSKNIIEKIWDSHIVSQQANMPVIFAIDKMIMHEVTSAQAFDAINEKGISVKYPEKILATLDHSIPTSQNREIINDPQARKQVEALRRNVKEHNIKLYDYNSGHQGIVHVMAPELGFTLPGNTLVCGDSHTSTHGAFGAMAFGVGTTEVGHVLATGCILQTKPKTMRVKFEGKPSKEATAKDLILKLIAQIGIGGAKGHIIEFTGKAITDLSMESRMTLCNMSIECGGRAGLIAPDETTFNYLKGKKYAPAVENWDEAIHYWKNLKSDRDAKFDTEIVVNVENLSSMISWGINPEQTISIDGTIPKLNELPNTHHQMAKQAYAYTHTKEGQKILGTPIQWAFIGSCTNGRIEDLRIAATILKNHKISPKVTFYIVPGSENVRQQAIDEGLDKIFKASGADFRMPGCSMCLAMNEDKVPPGQRCISTSNRNFIGRQGPDSITHLASPAIVTYSAIAGKIATQLEEKVA